ncbi:MULTISPECIES: hypothetical protein [Deinococcus]|uniref:Uncharacterized protein n=1 Tax=Deinococcus rufus TaxID=2136097 RepID=A0ABV7Z4W7_9DEIO|nr:hypothetical protein [Deinococcus sp. AB2017081]WQE95152.1 hypothetical protein U2P90_17465 [Deinococcus sp. AB2017081]
MSLDTKRLVQDVRVPALLLLFLALQMCLPGVSAAAIGWLNHVYFGVMGVLCLLGGAAMCWITLYPLLDRRARPDLWPLVEGTVIGHELTQGVTAWWWLGLPAQGACAVLLQLPDRQVRVVVKELRDIQITRPPRLRLKDVYAVGDSLILEEAQRRVTLGMLLPVRVAPGGPKRPGQPEGILRSEARPPSWHDLPLLLFGLVLLGMGGLGLSTFLQNVAR